MLNCLLSLFMDLGFIMYISSDIYVGFNILDRLFSSFKVGAPFAHGFKCINSYSLPSKLYIHSNIDNIGFYSASFPFFPNISIFNIKQNKLRFFSTTFIFYVNPLSLKNGSFDYINQIKLSDNLRFEFAKELKQIFKLGDIGWFGEDIELNSYGSFNLNVSSLQRVFDSFSPLNSYSLAIFVTSD